MRSSESLRRSFPEDGRSNPHPSGPGGDCRFEIGRHAHRERVQREAFVVELTLTIREPLEQRELLVEAIPRRRDAHQPTQREPRQLNDAARERQRFIRCDATFTSLVLEPDLDTYIEWRRVVRTLLIQPDRDPLAVE